MPPNVDEAVEWDETPVGLDTIAADLRAMRAAAGEPSYAEIGRRVAERRASRGVPAAERRVPRTTLFNCFRDGRRRIDVDLVIEVALALGLPSASRGRWRERIRLARAVADGAAIAVVRETVPEPVAHFAGRDTELGTLVAAPDSYPVWVSGMPGSGKTQLVLRFVQMLGGEAHYLDLRGHDAESPPVEPTAARRAVLRALGIEDWDEARRDRLGAALLVLDDATGPDQVAAIVGHRPAPGIVVTSRTALLGDDEGWLHLRLRGLESADVATLLTRMAEEQALRAEVDPGEAERLTRVTGGLPLAVSIVGGRIATHPEWTLGEHVDLIASRVEAGRVDDDLRVGIDLSYGQLSSAAAALLRAFADLPVAELGREEVGILVGHEDPTVLIDELATANLAVRRGADGIALHSLVRAHARHRTEETDPPRARDAAFARLGTHLAERVWAAYATVAEDVGIPARRTNFAFPSLPWDADGANAWLRRNLSSLLGMAHAARERGAPQLLFRISEGLSWWLNLSGNHADALRLHEAAADLAAEVGDVEALAMASLDAGQLLVSSDRPERARAHFARATKLLAQGEELADPGLAGVIGNMSALLDLRAGRVDDAIEGLRRAVDLHESLGEVPRLLSALVNLGTALFDRGDFAEQATVIERGLRHAEASGNALFVANLLVNRSEMHLHAGAPEHALADGERAATMADELGVHYLVVAADLTRAEALAARGDLDAALRLAEDARTRAALVGADMVTGDVAVTLASILAQRGDDREALALLAEAESVLADDGDHVLKGHVQRLRGELAHDPQERREHVARALAEYEKAGSFHAGVLRRRGP